MAKDSRDHLDLKWLMEQAQWQRTYQRLLQERLTLVMDAFMTNEKEDLKVLQIRAIVLKEIIDMPETMVREREEGGG